MKPLVSAAIVTATAAALAVPVTSHAADEPRRVANLSSNHPRAVDNPASGATGRAVINPYAAAGKICYRYAWEDMELRRLDLRRRSSGEQVALFYDENPTISGSVSGCTTIGASQFVPPLTRRQVREVREHPARFYVQASTYSGEKIAGNLHRPR